LKPVITRLFNDFFNSEKAGGFILIFCTVVSILVTNSGMGSGYLDFWHMSIGFDLGSIHLNHSLEYWINDGLMTIFFLLVGLEIERELYIGELSTFKNASLPLFAALGGMVAPAVIHFAFNQGLATQSGFGIPMATDIAFALGVLSLLGKGVPLSLKVFLTAFAIIDDLGAIIIIALFYTDHFSFLYFGLAMALFGLMFLFNRLKINHSIAYILPGIIMWYCMLQSGVHATISGVMLAFALPFGKGDENSISYRWQHALHKPVAFLILPLFALANTCIVFEDGWYKQLISPNSLGIMLGLLMGKPIGVMLFAFAAVKLKISSLAEDIRWSHLFTAGILGGIGFTMSVFITLLAYTEGATVIASKTAILLSSVVAGLSGFIYFKLTAGRAVKPSE